MESYGFESRHCNSFMSLIRIESGKQDSYFSIIPRDIINFMLLPMVSREIDFSCRQCSAKSEEEQKTVSLFRRIFKGAWHRKAHLEDPVIHLERQLSAHHNLVKDMQGLSIFIKKAVIPHMHLTLDEWIRTQQQLPHHPVFLQSVRTFFLMILEKCKLFKDTHSETFIPYQYARKLMSDPECSFLKYREVSGALLVPAAVMMNVWNFDVSLNRDVQLIDNIESIPHLLGNLYLTSESIYSDNAGKWPFTNFSSPILKALECKNMRSL